MDVKQVERQVAQGIRLSIAPAEGFFKRYYWIGWALAVVNATVGVYGHLIK